MFNVHKNRLIKSITPRYVLSFNARTISIHVKHLQLENVSVKQDLNNTDSEKKYKLQDDLKAGRIKISTKLRKRFPKREPLMKNLFVGKIDGDLFAYPEAIPKDALHSLRTRAEKTDQFFSNFLDKESIEKPNTMHENVKNNLKDLNIFGLNILQSFGGEEYFSSEELLASEFESKQLTMLQLLNQHRLVTKVIGDHATAQAAKKYLPKLASGELIGTIAFLEMEGSETGAFKTKANIRSDEKVFILNGEKSFVINSEASVFIVIATTIGADKLGDTTEGLSVFIVDANDPNILISTPDSTIGFNGLKQSTVQFSNVEIPLENLIGKFHAGIDVLQKMFQLGRLQTGILAKCAMSESLKEFSDFAINTKVMGASIMESDLVKKKLASMTGSIYALESMCYFTSGLMDLYENQDLDVEAAIVKVFALENMHKMAKDIIVTKGPLSLFVGSLTDNFFRNSAHLLTQGETIDSIKLFIGLSGLQHAGVSKHLISNL